MQSAVKTLSTLLVIAVAAGAVAYKYRAYLVNPWTRDGQVKAQVVQIAPRVSGPIIDLPIVDDQAVKAGDVLFRIDPRTFEASLDQARANLDSTRDNLASLAKQVEAAQAVVNASTEEVNQAKTEIESDISKERRAKQEFDRQTKLLKGGAGSQRAIEGAQTNYEVAADATSKARAYLAESQATLAQSEAQLAEARATLGAAGDANAQLRQAKAEVRNAELDLEFTVVKAPVDGYITNLSLQTGSQMVANQPVLALVDTGSFWIEGYFKETLLGPMQKGDRAVVTLMTYPDTPLTGVVDSIGWGIAQQDGSTSYDLLPQVSPTFEWIRLAQRVPVRIQLGELPDGIALRVGTTASVLVMTDGAGDPGAAQVVPGAPTVLQ